MKLTIHSEFCISVLSVDVITVRNEVAKVMFLHLSVILLTGREYLGRYPPGPGTPPQDQVHLPGPGTHPRDQVHPPGTRYTPQDQVHPPGTRYTPGTRYIPWTRYTPLGPGTPPSRDGYCCGRYASYWNAFLFRIADAHSISYCLLNTSV